MNKLDEIAADPGLRIADWDTYGAPPIDDRAIDAARQFLSRVNVVPTNQGGIQLEWHTHDVDFEIEFYPDGRVVALLTDPVKPERMMVVPEDA